jgi:acyl-CoA thioester hydrolase
LLARGGPSLRGLRGLRGLRWLRWQNRAMSSSTRQQPEQRSDYRVFRSISTRWSDNDIYGHINNTVYYSWFDTTINGLLIDSGALDIHGGEVIGLVVETQCNYFAPLAFPGDVVAGIRVAHIGASSVRYEIAIFPEDPAAPCAARGHFLHVYVGRLGRKPAALPAPLIRVLETLT